MIARGIPTISAADVAWISETDMIEVDRVMISDLHIELIQMMENAGRALARVVVEGASPATVAVAAGSRGNGGGGLVAARHLANADVDVVVITSRPRARMSSLAAHQLDILQRMGLEQRSEIPDVDVVIDAVIGYSLKGAPRGESKTLIEQISGSSVVVSLDNPSGLNVTTGETPGVVVVADATVTLALPKAGFAKSTSVGELYLADISVPPSVTSQFGSAAPRFGLSGLLRIV